MDRMKVRILPQLTENKKSKVFMKEKKTAFTYQAISKEIILSEEMLQG